MEKILKIQSLSRDIIANAGQYWGAKPTGNEFSVPSFAGEGYIKVFVCSPYIKMVVIQLSLLEELNFVKDVGDKEIISFAFRNAGGSKEYQETEFGRLFPAVQVTSSDVELLFTFPAGKRIHTIVIEIHKSILKECLQSSVDCLPFLKIIESQKSYLFEEIGSLEIVQIAKQIFKSTIETSLSSFYLRLKAEELIYLFFVEFLKRKSGNLYPTNRDDIEKINTIKDLIFKDLSNPPRIGQMAANIGMAETKMRRLFRQIYGMGLYEYYQAFRIKEAAFLIKEKNLSVSQVGYKMGFTNLSHFTRVFERETGYKPKKYSKN